MLLFPCRMVLLLALFAPFDFYTAGLLMTLDGFVLTSVENLFAEFTKDDGGGAVAVVIESLLNGAYLEAALQGTLHFDGGVGTFSDVAIDICHIFVIQYHLARANYLYLVDDILEFAPQLRKSVTLPAIGAIILLLVPVLYAL